MEPITGDVNVTLGAVTAAPPAPPHSYLGVADNLLAGITYAVAGLPDTATLMALGCVQAVENILKAYLSCKVDAKRLRDPAVQHDLVALWGLAYTEGLAVAPVPPGWLVRLNDMTGQTIPGDTTGQTKFNLRYGGKSHAIVIPVAEPMVSDIAALLAQVRTQLTT